MTVVGPALIGMKTNPQAVSQLWLFIVAPVLGAAAAGVLFRPGGLLAAED